LQKFQRERQPVPSGKGFPSLGFLNAKSATPIHQHEKNGHRAIREDESSERGNATDFEIRRKRKRSEFNNTLTAEKLEREELAKGRLKEFWREGEGEGGPETYKGIQKKKGRTKTP
jgi:hypothetical protein